VVSGLLPNSIYVFRLRVRILGEESYSPLPGPMSSVLVTPSPRAPSRPPPPNLSARSVDSITVAVQAASNDFYEQINEYEVQVEGSTIGTWTLLPPASLSSSSSSKFHSSAFLSGLLPSSSHRFRARVLNSAGASPWSSPSSVYTTLEGAPKTPAAPQFTAATSSSLTVSWSPGEDENENENGAELDSFELSYRPTHSPSSPSSWITPSSSSKIPAQGQG